MQFVDLDDSTAVETDKGNYPQGQYQKFDVADLNALYKELDEILVPPPNGPSWKEDDGKGAAANGAAASKLPAALPRPGQAAINQAAKHIGQIATAGIVAPVAAKAMEGHKGENKKGVVYPSVEDRYKKFSVKPGASLKWGEKNLLLDTQEYKKQYLHLYEKSGQQLPDIGMANGLNEQTFLWGMQSMIWACVLDEGQYRFFTTLPRIDLVHHSSLVAGKDVVGAGEWIVRSGMLRAISANSGHYRPTIDHLHKSVLALSSAWNSETMVMLYDPKSSKWVYVPVKEFAEFPSGKDGRLKVHSEA
jgi:hypothetical protein